MKIRVKLTLQFFVVVATILILSMYFVYNRFQEITVREYYNNLKTKAHMTAEMVLHKGDLKKLEDITPAAANSSLPISDNVIIFNSKFEKVFTFNRRQSVSIPFDIVSNSKKEYAYHDSDIYYYGLPYVSGSGSKYYVVASSYFNSKELMDLRRIITLAIIISLVVVGLSGFFYTRHALSPISSIVNQMDKLNMDKMDTKLKSTNGKDEIEHLIKSINNLLYRIQNSVTFQKMFISNVSHELKNPITIVLSQIDVLLSQPHRSLKEYRETLISLREDVKDIADITENLLQMAKIKSEGFQLDIQEFQLDEAILECQTKLLRVHPEFSVNFEIEGQPDSFDSLTVRGNEALLKLAFSNLIDNCCKYSYDNNVNVSIKPDNDHVILKFSDRGSGIPQKELGKIFQPFYRNITTKNIKGYGIGLSLIDAVMSVHKLNLDVQSVPNIGSVFTIAFETAPQKKQLHPV
ncbi:MAG: HAMP domain-containing histidine kinase [Saprospiraceae bacterium]|nr:HAMP domain-containing histidine kinase [Saprospiraceae bacterium]